MFATTLQELREKKYIIHQSSCLLLPLYFTVCDCFLFSRLHAYINRSVSRSFTIFEWILTNILRKLSEQMTNPVEYPATNLHIPFYFVVYFYFKEIEREKKIKKYSLFGHEFITCARVYARPRSIHLQNIFLCAVTTNYWCFFYLKLLLLVSQTTYTKKGEYHVDLLTQMRSYQNWHTWKEFLTQCVRILRFFSR